MGLFTRSRAPRILGGIALVGAGALVLAGCSGSSSPESSGSADAGFEFPIDCNAAEPAAYTPTYNSTSTGPGTDLTYKIGTALPVTGNLAFLGPPEISGVGLAVSDIVAAGDKACTFWTDSGDSNDMTVSSASADKLINEGVSLVVGAASSSVSLNVVDKLTKGANPIVQISPANTAASPPTYVVPRGDGTARRSWTTCLPAEE